MLIKDHSDLENFNCSMKLAKQIEDKHLEKAKERFIKFGECPHLEKYQEITSPYNCDVELITCKVCNKLLKKVYLE
jgi:hypothetical protein